MKVAPCNFDDELKTEPTPKTLSYDEIKEREGVYKVADEIPSDDRLIVLHERDFDNVRCVILWYYPAANILAPADDSWCDNDFFRMDDEEFCVGIKKV